MAETELAPPEKSRLVEQWQDFSRRTVDGLRRIWGWYGSLSLVGKLLISGAVSAIGGSGLVGFVSEYAAYSFAVYYGIRPPLEGIPFLRVAVTALTFGVFVGGATVFLAILAASQLAVWYVYSLLRQILAVPRMLQKLIVRHLPTSVKLLKIKFPLLPQPEELVTRYLMPRTPRQISILVASFAVVIFFGNLVDGSFERSGTQFALLVIAAQFLLVSLTLLLLWRRALVIPLAAISTLIFFILLPATLFHAPSYGRLLRGHGYGGGAEVTIALLSEDGRLEPGPTGFLVIRTTNALILLSRDGHMLRELPLAVVGSVDQTARTRQHRNWRLPPPSIQPRATRRHPVDGGELTNES